MTHTLARKLGPDGVRVNAIAPGHHITVMSEGLRRSSYCTAAIAGRTALRRWGTTDDVVGAALFFSSPAAA